MFVTIYNPAPTSRAFDAEGHMVDGFSWETADSDTDPAKSLIAARHLVVVDIAAGPDVNPAALAASQATAAKNAPAQTAPNPPTTPTPPAAPPAAPASPDPAKAA